MLSWRLLGSVATALVVVALGWSLLALSPASAEVPGVLSLSKDTAPLAATLRQAQGVAPIVREFAVVTNTAWQWQPAISGSIVVWEDQRNGNWDIYGKNLATGQEFPVVTGPAYQWGPAVSGNIVVWTDHRNGAYNPDIYGKDLATGVEFAIATNPASQGNPAINGNLVVWEDNRNGNNADIYGKDLASGEEFRITANPSDAVEPAISGNLVVWWDFRNGNSDIYGARLEWPPAPGACSLTGTVRGQRGSYYLEEAGRVVAFLYGASVNFAAYLGQRVTVGGPCKVWQESAGPRPVFLAETIILAGVQRGSGPPAKPSKGATRGW